MLPVRLLDFEP